MLLYSNSFHFCKSSSFASKYPIIHVTLVYVVVPLSVYSITVLGSHWFGWSKRFYGKKVYYYFFYKFFIDIIGFYFGWAVIQSSVRAIKQFYCYLDFRLAFSIFVFSTIGLSLIVKERISRGLCTNLFQAFSANRFVATSRNF